MALLPQPPPRSPAAGGWGDLPEDIALAVASLLEVADVCALGGCSRSWRRTCAADCVWAGLFRRRWPAAAAAAATDGGEGASSVEGWKALYINYHRRMGFSISSVVDFVEFCSHNGSLESEYYLKAISDLTSMEVGFIDVQLLLFSRKLSTILNLIGLHYSIAILQIPLNKVHDALQGRQVAERQVCVSLLKLGRWFYGFRLPDENESHKVSLSELTMARGQTS